MKFGRAKNIALTALAAAIGMAASPALADTQIIGAGSTFIFPFFSRAFYEYNRDNADVSVNYQSIGSGGGIQQFISKVVDFGASDVPMNAKELKSAADAGGQVVQFPVALGGEAIAYNVPGAPEHLRMTAALLANVFLGKVTKWNDAAIARLNPGGKLPDLPIVVAHRADGSGTTYIFTDYLSTASGEWKSRVGTGKVVNWPAKSAVGAKGNEGVAGFVSNTPGAIGYIELAYALENKIAYAAMQNRAGKFVLPSIDSVRAAAAQKQAVSPTDFSIVDQDGNDAYPISGFVWAMLWKNQPDHAKGQQRVKLFRWVVSSGQNFAVRVRYVGLPQQIQTLALRALATIRT